jgi:hypothetical protein
VLTRAGPIAVAGGDVFRWSEQTERWRELSVELPVVDVGVSLLAANDDRLVVGFDNEELWGRSLRSRVVE